MASAGNVNYSLAADSGSNIISMFIQGEVTGNINMPVEIQISDDQLREFTQGLGQQNALLLNALIKSEDLQSKMEENQRLLGQISQFLQSNPVLTSPIQEYAQQNKGLVKDLTYQLDEGGDEDSRQLKQFIKKTLEEIRPENSPSREKLIHGFWAVVTVAVALTTYFCTKLRRRKWPVPVKARNRCSTINEILKRRDMMGTST
ncbi:hypothetical protein AOXY_G3832 [Acipenser oxyrinchus oxyrinchus]|uniref:Uncharacterized protein n=1 Tax=Acipenser oxyrinchus oxyrinchus TaxID=40147 RepID=A0AAD8GG88_ACIOX|nr:hypothetical protein AOXY_G3832 [Acipenser oxyrinchus oxyrinchus]